MARRQTILFAMLRDEIANSIDAAALQGILGVHIVMASPGGGLQHLVKVCRKDDAGATAVRRGDLLTEISGCEPACIPVQMCFHLLQYGDAAREDYFMLPNKSELSWPIYRRSWSCGE